MQTRRKRKKKRERPTFSQSVYTYSRNEGTLVLPNYVPYKRVTITRTENGVERTEEAL